MKKALSLILALTLCLSFAVTVLATNDSTNAKIQAPTEEEAETHFTLTSTSEDIYIKGEPFYLADYGYDSPYATEYDLGFGTGTYVLNSYAGYNLIEPDTVFTVTNTAEDINCRITLYLDCYTSERYDYVSLGGTEGDGINIGTAGIASVGKYKDRHYLALDMESAFLSTYDNAWIIPPLGGEVLRLTPGQSVSFDFSKIREWENLVHQGDDNMYILTIWTSYPDFKCSYSFSYLFHSGKIEDTANPSYPIYIGKELGLLDNGVKYEYTITNHTAEAMDGYYALLSYTPEHDTYLMQAQFHPFELHLAPGESVTDTLSSNFYDMSQSKMCWLEFENKEECEEFFSDIAFVDYRGYYVVRSSETHDVAWLESKLGIDLER